LQIELNCFNSEKSPTNSIDFPHLLASTKRLLLSYGAANLI
jgi:hypothetical protein